MAVCRGCGTSNADGAKFCNECAAPLTAPAPASEQRKVVTVLFADVTGSTQLGEQLDPESLRHVLARYFEVASTAIERHGGTVEKFIGDAVMAVFGIPKVHEDDAPRAVRAAADLRVDLDALNAELQRDYGTSLQIRVGVNTGEVVTGTAERLATGDTVNVAARLEQLAEPGEVLVGEPTRQLLDEAFDLKELAPATLKGKSTPLRVFRLLSASPAGARVLSSPMVGRVQQLQLLQNSFAVACRDRTCSLFTVLGSAGVGKSRLVAEFLRDLDATVVGGRCLSYGEGITYWPLVEILTQLRSGATAERFADAVDHDPAVGSAVSAVMDQGGSGAISSSDIAWGIRRLLERVAEDRPLVVVVDDVHWAQPVLLDLLDHVVDLSRDRPLLVLVMARPELLELRPGWGGGKLSAATVLLEPLNQAETDQLLQELAPDLGEARREQVRTASGGNPLFVEAMVPLVVAAPEGPVTLPPTIQALVAARLDQLDDAQRRVLACGAVEGQLFHRGTVAALLPDEADLGSLLTSLVRKDLLRPDRSFVPGDEAYRFRHLAIRDAAYEALSKAARAELHKGFAGWLDGTVQLPEQDELVGYHLEQSYRFREQLGPVDDASRTVATKGAARLESAARKSMLRGDALAALNLLDRAQRLRPDADLDLPLEMARHDALLSCGRLHEAVELMGRVAEQAEALGDSLGALRARLTGLETQVAMEPDRLPEMEALVDRVRPELEGATDPAALIPLYRAVAALAGHSSRYGHRLAADLEVLRNAELAGDLLEVARARTALARTVPWSPLPLSEGLALLDRLDADAGSASLDSRDSRSLLLALGGDIRAARELHEQVLQELLDRGRTLSAAHAGQAGWLIEICAGDMAAAERVVRASYAQLEATGERSYLSTQACYVAESCYQGDRLDEAEEWARRGRSLGAEDDTITQSWADLIEAKVLARRGSHEAAEQLADRGLARTDDTQNPLLLGHVRVWRAEVLQLAGRSEPAAALFAQGIAAVEGKGATAISEHLRRHARSIGLTD